MIPRIWLSLTFLAKTYALSGEAKTLGIRGGRAPAHAPRREREGTLESREGRNWQPEAAQGRKLRVGDAARCGLHVWDWDENDCNGDLRAKWGFEGSNRGPTRPLLLTQVLKFGFEGLSRGYIRVALRCTMAIRCLLHLIVLPFRALSVYVRAELHCTFLQAGKPNLPETREGSTLSRCMGTRGL
jgi:hypothetical protein